MVRLPPINDCKRAYLSDTMPFPEIPSSSKFIGMNVLDNIDCNYFLYEEFQTRVHMYFRVSDGAPVKLIQENVDNEEKESEPLLTYDFSNISLEPPNSELFHPPIPFNKETCIRHVGGFPYLHIFHYFVRF